MRLGMDYFFARDQSDTLSDNTRVWLYVLTELMIVVLKRSDITGRLLLVNLGSMCLG